MSEESSSVYNAKVLVESPRKRFSVLYSWDYGRQFKIKYVGVTDVEVVDATPEAVA